eukprot:c10595_g1_i1.p1 GENE.c10595_g1_i1~~c10595_g1_i1.p1  ORF type:complete len:238 (+),score=60.72 c10595_g1_i1:604-1317(+)
MFLYACVFHSVIPLVFTLPPATTDSFELLDYQWCWISSSKPLYRWLCFYLLLFLVLCVNVGILIRLSTMNRRTSVIRVQLVTSSLLDNNGNSTNNNSIPASTAPCDFCDNTITSSTANSNNSMQSASAQCYEHNAAAAAAAARTDPFDEARQRAQRLMYVYVLVFIFSRGWAVADRINDQVHGPAEMFWNTTHTCFSLLQGFLNALVFGTSPLLRREYRKIFSRLVKRRDLLLLNHE